MKASQSKPASAEKDVVAGLWEVTKTYDGYLTRSLDTVSLTVRRGEILGVFGATGSGKSTLLAIIAGRLRPTEGKVKVLGRVPWRGAAKSRIGYLPGANSNSRKSDFARWMNIFSSLFARKQVLRAASATNRRSGLKQAVLGNRDLIVLDDPFADIEVKDRQEVRELIRSLAGSGRTVIFSSDTLSDAVNLCDRVAICHDGKIQGVGGLGELLAARDAIRFTGPLLPPDVASRVLEVIREELKSGTATSHTPKTGGEPVTITASNQAHPAAAPVGDFLEPLVKSSSLAEPKKTGAASLPDKREQTSAETQADRKLSGLVQKPK